MSRWEFHAEGEQWRGSQRLFIARRDLGVLRVVKPMEFTDFEPGAEIDRPALEETREERRDNCGDVTGFLQAALDSAWAIGLRPRGFEDHQNELSATRYHLEDLRALALGTAVQERRR